MAGGTLRNTALGRALLDDPEHGWLPSLLLILTVLSGMVDAVSILSLGHVFVANMTGNLVFSGFAISGASGFSLGTTLVALVAFVLGAVICRLAITARRAERRTVLRDGIAVQVALLAAATVISLIVGSAPTGAARHGLAAVCGVAMGIQNGVASRMAVPELTTTVMTRTLVGLVNGWGVRSRERGEIRQGASVLALVTGAIGGALLVRLIAPSAALGLATALAVTVAVLAATTRPAPE